ncbi:family 78 glycoside hydrolase catalytic domain [Acidobacteriota bacterium]
MNQLTQKFKLFGISALLILFQILSCKTVSRYSNLSLDGLRCEYKHTPLAIQDKQPQLGWILRSKERGQYQTAFRILVSDDQKQLKKDIGNLWDSGRIESPESLQISYEGSSLRSGQRCYWKAMVWDKDGTASHWSESSFWEMGLLNPSDWEGVWISDGKSDPVQEEEFYQDDPAPLLRKEFDLKKKVKKARLYISGLGYYEARLNGNRVGDRYLDPGWTDYEKRIFYSSFDVTKLLHRGKNCVGVILGNGWYNPLPLRMWGRLNLREHLPIGRPRFIAQLNIEMKDGSQQTVFSNPEWKVQDGPLLRNNVFLGEVFDARQKIKGWDSPGLDTHEWTSANAVQSPGGLLEAQPQPPIRITEEIKPVEITEPLPNVFIFDFGQNFAGTVRLRIGASSGTRITLRYGELLDEAGHLNPMTSVAGQIKGKRQDGQNRGGPGSPEIAVQEDIYITGEKRENTYIPQFTFRGFRFVEISGLSRKPDLGMLTGLRLNSDIPSAGRYECSNEFVNRIQDMTRWTFLSNIFSVQSDCPHREKFGYGGDLAATSDAFMLNFDMATFYPKAVTDWGDAVFPNGKLTDTAPFVGIDYCGIPWAMAHPQLLLQLYQYYGNRRLMEQQYTTARTWMELLMKKYPDRIITEGLSDHESLEPTPSPEMVTPLFYQSARYLAHLASQLGKTEDIERYSGLAEEIKMKYLDNFHVSGTGKFKPFTQASQAFALYLDLVPKDEIEAALEYLIDKIMTEHNGHLSTGIFGTKFLLEVLSRYGRSDVAWKIVNTKTFPGWGYMVQNGATTLWEHWEFSDNTFSHNHPMFGSVSEWFFKWLAGIQSQPDAVGFNKILIRPQPVSGIDWVKSEYKSVRGSIRSEWKLENGVFQLKTHIPPNTHGIVYLPTDNAETVQENSLQAIISPGITYKGYENGCAVYDILPGSYDFVSEYRGTEYLF